METEDILALGGVLCASIAVVCYLILLILDIAKAV